MSEEEVLNIIKPIVNARKTHCDNHLYSLQLTACQLDAIQGLLDLYNKEKEKNKELEDADLTTVYINGFYDGEKKWKDKIRKIFKENEDLYRWHKKYIADIDIYILEKQLWLKEIEVTHKIYKLLQKEE